jgi:hypothetical protein
LLTLTLQPCPSLPLAAAWMGQQQALCPLLPVWVGAGIQQELLQQQQTLPASHHCRFESMFYNRGWVALNLYKPSPHKQQATAIQVACYSHRHQYALKKTWHSSVMLLRSNIDYIIYDNSEPWTGQGMKLNGCGIFEDNIPTAGWRQ